MTRRSKITLFSLQFTACALGALLALLLAACAGDRAPATPAAPTAPRISFLEPRVYAFPGRSLVIPIALRDPADFPPGAALLAELGPGRRVPAALHRLVPAPAPLDQPRAIDQWLAVGPPWAIASSHDGRPGAVSIVVVDLPADAAGHSLRLDGAAVPIQWLPPPQSLPPRADAAHPPPPDSPADWTLADLLAPAGAHPAHRWRIALLGPAFDELRLPLRHPALEALARQTEDRWLAALARLAAFDAPLADRLREELALILRIDGERSVPAWPTDSGALATLLDTLLGPALLPRQRADRAAAWLSSLPPATTWIIDDAAAADGATVVAAGVANRRPEAAFASLTPVGAAPGAEGPRIALRPYSGGVVVSAVRGARGDAAAAAPPPLVEISVGDWRARHPTLAGAVRARPPGMRTGPFLEPWSLFEWETGAPTPARPDAATGALLQRSASSDGWELYIEARTPPAPPRPETLDVVRIWLGPAGAPLARLRIQSDGALVDERPPGRIIGALPIRREPGRWSVIVPIPPEAIEPGPTLRIALERIDAHAQRSTWPRAVLPWRTEPGRVAINLNSWADLPTQQD